MKLIWLVMVFCLLVGPSNFSGTSVDSAPSGASTSAQLTLNRDTININARRVEVTLFVTLRYDYNTSFDEVLLWVTGCDDNLLPEAKLSSDANWSWFQGKLTTLAWLAGNPAMFPFDFYALSIDVQFPAPFNFTQTAPTPRVPITELYLWRMEPQPSTWANSTIHFSVILCRVGWEIVPHLFPSAIAFLLLGGTVLIRKKRSPTGQELSMRLEVYIALLLWFVGFTFALQSLVPSNRSFLSIGELFNIASASALVVFVFTSIVSLFWWKDVGHLDWLGLILAAAMPALYFLTSGGIALVFTAYFSAFVVVYVVVAFLLSLGYIIRSVKN